MQTFRSAPPQNKKPLNQMSKIEMEEAIKKYRFVMFKLHQEIEQKDAEIARLSKLLDKGSPSK